MLTSIRDFFTRRMEVADEQLTEEDRQDRVQVAACALMLELAYADDEFTESERQNLFAAVQRQFGLDPATAKDLVSFADQERRKSVDLYQFTSLICRHYDTAQKMVLAEMMWGLVFADGEVAKHESYLMKKISRLLNLEPAYLAEAKRRANPS